MALGRRGGSAPARGDRAAGKTREERRRPIAAAEGLGPLLQRDYVAVVEGASAGPEEALALLRRDFPELAPRELARFTRPAEERGPLEPGHTMRVAIRGAGTAGVVVTRVEPRSLTLRTLAGHVEAGRISFAAERDAVGRLVLRIRSRSTISDPFRYPGYHLFGRRMQTRIWTCFLERLARRCGGRLAGSLCVATTRVRRPAGEERGDRTPNDTPTLAPA